MKRFFQVVCMALLVLASHAVSEAQNHFTAKINGAQEVPAVTTSASGTGVFVLSSAGLRFDITVQGLSGSIQGAHFHNARLGVNGAIVRTMSGTGNTFTGTWASTDPEPLTPTLMTELLAGNIYVNFHTAANSGGEIRGQLVPSGRVAELTGAQEVPAVSTDATGLGFFRLTDAGVTYRIIVRGLSGAITAAHFHNGAPGVNGAVVRTITADFTGDTASGTWTSSDSEPLTASLVQALRDGNIYVNIHTAANPGGEIRGQIEPTPLGFVLDGSQEVPPVTTTASGVGLAAPTVQGIRFNVTVDGLTGAVQAGHFHNAARGVNGSVVRTITFAGNAASGLWAASDSEPLTAALLDAFKAGNVYVNIHTAANPNGEIRGQIVPAGLVASILPTSRSVQVGTPATAFGTIINTGSPTAVDCQLAAGASVPATFTFQTTNPSTNAVTGTADRLVDVTGGATQTFVFAFTPSGAFAPTDVPIVFSCGNTSNAPTTTGLTTILLSASAAPVPDIVALAATIGMDGIVNIPGATGTGVFSVATVNVGASGTITVSADTGSASPPLTVALCETNPVSGACVSAVGSSVTTQINANATPTFGVFVTGAGNVAFDPAGTRIFVRFRDQDGATRGSTSVAVRTQ